MIKNSARTLRVAVLAGALSFTGGCGVELAMIGAAASAASSGSAVFKRGKLDASWMGPFDHIVAAGEVAGSELGLSIRSTDGSPTEGYWKTVMYTADGDKIVVKTYRKTNNLTEFQIDVGLSGSEPTARLLLKRMAVAINLDARQDGSGEVVPLLPTPPLLPPEPQDIPDSSDASGPPDAERPMRPVTGERL